MPSPDGGGSQPCLVIHPHQRTSAISRDLSARLEEAIGLARAIDLWVVHAEVVNLGKIRPSTLLGKGAVERIGGLVSRFNSNQGAHDDQDSKKTVMVFVDATLSPVQQRNLERVWKSKVIDRNGLIIEIFGARAKTSEGRLQVELAALNYQRSRLVRSWAHLERQRGGAGFFAGPGEKQIESDRRQIVRRISQIKQKIAEVKRTRHLHRQARQRVPYPLVSLVGYTNAGKSTLFNALTKSKASVKDQLFVTLDPSMRALDLPSGRRAILSDTVGFISGLPHELVNAFHATLEEVLAAGIVIHVRDVSHPDSEFQNQDVLKVLSELGVKDMGILIEALNKIDLLPDGARQGLQNRSKRGGEPAQVALSALSGDGVQDLLLLLDARLSSSLLVMDIDLAPGDGRTMAWLYRHAEVLEREDLDDGIHLKVRLDGQNKARLERMRERT